MPGLRQIRYLWVGRKSWWGIHFSCTPHMNMSDLQAPGVSSFTEPSKSILRWWDHTRDQLRWCHKQNSPDLGKWGWGWTHKVFFLPVFSFYLFPLLQCGFCMGHGPFGRVPALACILCEPQSLLECPCPGNNHPWAVSPQ